MIEQGRPENAIGVHTRGKNNISIGIALTGNFQIINPSLEQILSLRKLILFLRGKYDIPLERVILHRQAGATVCPGKNFTRGILG